MVAEDVSLRLGFLFGCCFMPVVIHDFKMVGADLFPASCSKRVSSGFCPQQAQNVQASDNFCSFSLLAGDFDNLRDRPRIAA
jgi:hypothetical protein